MGKPVRSKLTLNGDRVDIDASDAIEIVTDIFIRLGCSGPNAKIVAEHLADTSLLM